MTAAARGSAQAQTTGTPVVGVVGWKNSGKTTLVVALVAELTRRGRRVATLKHAHHNLRLDDEDTDSSRHRRAGAQQVAVVSSRRWALMSETPDGPELDFADAIALFGPADIIIVEGYKSQPIPKIEARRLAAHDGRGMAGDDPNVIAIGADHPVADADVPVFALDDIKGMADFIDARFGLSGSR